MSRTSRLNRAAFSALLLVLSAGAASAAGAAPTKSSVLPGGSSKEPISIEADKLDYFDKEQKAIYSGHVIAKQGETILRCSALTILLDKGAPGADAGGPAQSSQIKQMDAAGPVVVNQKDQIGTGDRGMFNKAENKLHLIGHVSLSQGKNVQTGDELVYDLASGQATVKGGRVKGYFVPGTEKKN